jgi:glycosyltransferase involved in cell wall biosynthesis
MVALVKRLLPGTLGELAELAYNLPAYRRLKAVYLQEKPDFVYERCNLYFLAGAWLARRHGARLFLEVNSPLADERQKHGGLRLARLAKRLEIYTWRSAERVLPVTRVLADILVENGVDEGRIKVIPNGIDLARFPSRGPGAEETTVTLGFVGFVRAWHGLDLVIEGMAGGVANSRLVVVGDGPAVADLASLAARLGIADRVSFRGLVPPAQVAGLVASFDIALQPSATPYASPLKIFDYMAAGCAIVAPDQPNIREILTQNVTAVLFPPEAPGAMWRSVERLIGDSALRSRLGSAARAELLLRRYTWSGNAERVVALASDFNSSARA